MRELRADGARLRGEARVLRDRAGLELTEAVTIVTSSWRERGGSKWLSIKLPHHQFQDGELIQELELFIPIEVFTQQAAEAVPGPRRVHVAR